jgi:hypothetical protein
MNRIEEKITTQITNKSLSNEAKFNHLGIAQTKQNCMHKEINYSWKCRQCLLLLDPVSFVFPLSIRA